MAFHSRTWLGMSLFALTAAPALAQQVGSQLGSELLWLKQEDVIVTNDRAPRRIETIPSNVTVITAEQIERSGARQVPDVLRWHASVDTHDFFGNSAQADVDVRGFGINADSSVLVLVDGRRINGITLFSTDWTLIPLERVARIEIVRGGSSVMYGAQAIGGVVNIITKRGTVEKQLHAGIDTGSWRYWKPYANLSGSALLAGGSLTYHLNASRSHSRGYRENGGQDLQAQGVSANYENGRFAFDASAGHKSSEAGRPGGVFDGADRRGGAADNRAVSDDIDLRLVPAYRLGQDQRVQLALDHRRTASEAFMSFGGLPVSIDDRVELTTLAPQYTGSFRFAASTHRLTAGYEQQRSTLRRRSGLGDEDAVLVARAFYLLDTVSLLDDVLTLDAGWRREKFDYRLSSGTGKMSANAAKLGLTWNYREGSKLFASFDRSYRVQLLDELGTPALLRPPVSTQYQVGGSHRFQKGTEVRAALFEIRTRDEIMLDPVTFSNVNWPDTRRRGLEIEGSMALRENLSVFGSFSQLDATTRAGPYAGRQIPLTPRSKGTVGLTWLPARGWTLDAKVRWTRGNILSGDFDNVGQWTDSYQVADFGLMYKQGRVTLAAGVLNATNRKYAEVGFYLGAFGKTTYPHPERTYYLNLSVTGLF